MSARMPVALAESDSNTDNMHHWLERINDGMDVTELGSSQLATVCSSAVDPLEIAVALEVAGISHAVATDRYNRPDVFALARTLWSRIPLRPALAKPAVVPRSGDQRDLARGLLYVLPAVMLLALTKTFDLELARWVLPLAISWGWGLGQVAAFVGYRLQGTDLRYEAVIMARVVAGSAVATLIVSMATTFTAGGGGIAVVATTSLVTYMVASAILLVRAEERWLAALLLPGALASAFVLVQSNGSVLSRTVAAVAIGGSFLAVICRAIRQARFRTSAGGGRFARRDVAIASGHLLHGVICGVAVSLVVIQLSHSATENEFDRMLLPVPLLASLGVMEWQLHTFGSRMSRLIHSLNSMDRYPELSRRVFYRSLAICVATIVTAAAAVASAIRIHGGDIPTSALTVQCALGAVFFTDLIMVLLDRLDLVLRSWLFGIAAGTVAFVSTLLIAGTEAGEAVLPAAAVLVAVVLASLLLHARQVVAAAMNH